MILASPTAAPAPPPLVTATVAQLPKDIPAIDALPAGTVDHGAPEHLFDWNLATLKWPDGYSPTTGEPVFGRQRVVHAPYPEFREALRLDASTPFDQVVATARARAGFEMDNSVGAPQAILQGRDGTWLLTSAGSRESSDHIEPISLDLRSKDLEVRQHVRELKAIVDSERWVDFTAQG